MFEKCLIFQNHTSINNFPPNNFITGLCKDIFYRPYNLCLMKSDNEKKKYVFLFVYGLVKKLYIFIVQRIIPVLYEKKKNINIYKIHYLYLYDFKSN